MTTIKDIAKKSDVSISTVSRILNMDPNLSVSNSTRKRVIQIAEELNYNTEKLQKNKKWTKSIAVVTTLSADEERADEYYRKIWKGIYEASEQKGVKVTNIFRLKNLYESLNVAKFAAVIFVGAIDKNSIHELYLKNNNLVLIDDHLIQLDGVDAVSTNFKDKTFELLDEFLRAGYKNIAFIGGQRESMNLHGDFVSVEEDVRSLAYREWMTAHRMVPHIMLTGWQSESGVIATRQLLKSTKNIDAILVASDPLAVGVLKEIAGQAKNIAVASFNDVEISQYLTPALTTVHVPAEEMDRTALSQAVERSMSERKWPTWLLVPGYIVFRDSFAKK